MTCQFSLLDEPLIRTRLAANGQPCSFTLPGLLAALQRDEVRDFPALRPHQRHPWHAFLVQLAAIALHRAGTSEPFTDEAAWRSALLELTPDDPDGAAWCLVSPTDRPAFMQPPVPGENVEKWTNRLVAPDQLDMLVTSKNHDLKAARMTRSYPDDWILSLISLQTQEGYGGKMNYGIARMNGGFGSRQAIGLNSNVGWGSRWKQDKEKLLESREQLLDGGFGYPNQDGHALLWCIPWDGSTSLSLSRLDPYFIEVCRKVRLVSEVDTINAYVTTTSTRRVAAEQQKGYTGDIWTSIDITTGEAFKIRKEGFDYQTASALIYGIEYKKRKFLCPPALQFRKSDQGIGYQIVLQGVSRGGPTGTKSVTQGYHERRVPISPKVGRLWKAQKIDQVAAVAENRILAIATLQKTLWVSLATLFDKGNAKDRFSDGASDKAKLFTQKFETEEDYRFFADLNAEIEADDPAQARLDWLIAMAQRAEVTLKLAFEAGPRSGEQRYRARVAALSRFHGSLRGAKSPLPDLANYYREQKLQKETADDAA